jgi:hypothetical protein
MQEKRIYDKSAEKIQEIGEAELVEKSISGTTQ